jgi:copper homeostasis protein (lipoprotein)
MKKCVYLLLISIFAIGLSVRVQGQAILNKEWMLVEMGNEKVTTDAEKTPFIKLSEGQLSGFSGCNRLMGSYMLEGEVLTFNRVGGTKMFCFDAQELENKFMQSLEKTHYWKYKCKKLHIFDENKILIMRLKIKK